MRTARLILLLLPALIVTACYNTSTMNSWSDPASRGKVLKQIAVVGFRRSELNRRLFEDKLCSLLNQHGAKAVQSYTFMNAEPDTNADALLEELKKDGFDGVLVSHVIGITSDVQSTPGKTRFVPEVRYNRFGNYYSTVMTEEYTDGTETVYEFIQIQTNDRASDGVLVWAGLSETERTGDIKSRIEDYSSSVVRDLATNRLIQ